MHARKNKRCSPRVAAAFLVVGNVLLSMSADAANEIAHDVKLPPETAVLRPSELPGYAIALQKCGICHSADYINLQPPHMSLSQWTAEMAKMQHSYCAPINESEIKLLGIYLTSAYGDAATVSAIDSTAPVPIPVATGDSTKIDVQAVLAHNVCLGVPLARQIAVLLNHY